jgi:ketosteroid isomerase-like protein
MAKDALSVQLGRSAASNITSAPAPADWAPEPGARRLCCHAAAVIEGTMLRRELLLIAVLLGGALLGLNSAAAEEASEQAVKAANDAYYAALSDRNSSEIEHVWAQNAEVTNIFAVNPAPTVGWNGVESAYNSLFAHFPKLSVTMPEPMVRVEGDTALVVGVETQEAELSNGSSVRAGLPATNVFLKQGGEWLMVHHQTSRPPS